MNNIFKKTLGLSILGISLTVLEGSHGIAMKRAKILQNMGEDERRKIFSVIKPSFNPDDERKKEESRRGALKFDEERQEYYYGKTLAEVEALKGVE